ncbi:uncharacterized protein LOC123013848 [Tribolium madens]|uniref:uncharacterized protein LOC123013848 n=1 Tax=Tribolium madens TaxID=41895 RepID=UPI001CF73028|nr:uncharacterized protein LOC123013848 [Tribolium madens]
MSPLRSLPILVVFITIARGEKISDKSEHKKSISRDCANSYTTTCLKLDIVSWVDKLNEQDDYSVLPGVSVIRENPNGTNPNTADIVAELARDFPNDPDARLDAFLMKKLTGYLNSHSVRLNLFDGKSEVTARGGGGGGGGGGGKKGGGGGMGAILAAGAMMKGTLFALALGGLAALAGKALMTALISLVLSAVIGLKSLTHGGGKSTTYEVIAKPIYTHANTHSVSHEEHGGGGHYGHSGYGRSLDMPLPLGLQPGYKPQ